MFTPWEGGRRRRGGAGGRRLRRGGRRGAPAARARGGAAPASGRARAGAGDGRAAGAAPGGGGGGGTGASSSFFRRSFSRRRAWGRGARGDERVGRKRGGTRGRRDGAATLSSRRAETFFLRLRIPRVQEVPNERGCPSPGSTLARTGATRGFRWAHLDGGGDGGELIVHLGGAHGVAATRLGWEQDGDMRSDDGSRKGEFIPIVWDRPRRGVAAPRLMRASIRRLRDAKPSATGLSARFRIARAHPGLEPGRRTRLSAPLRAVHAFAANPRSREDFTPASATARAGPR